VLVMVLSFTACGGEAGLPSAEDIIDSVIEAQDDIRAYEFEMDVNLDASGEEAGETFEANIAVASSGALDLDNRQMRMELATDMAVPGEDEIETGMEMYLVDNMGYVMLDEPGQEPVWIKSEAAEGDWEEVVELMATTEPQIELLQAAQVEVLRSEKVKGVDCYLLQLTPDMDRLWETVFQQAALGGQGIPLPEVPEELLDEVFSDFSVKQWVAKDTYFLMKVEIDMAMELTAEAMEVEEGEMDMDITLSFLAYNHNESISIVVPPEAEEAGLPSAEDIIDSVIEAQDDITFTVPDSLPPATVGVAYEFTFSTADNPAGGNPPYTFMLGSGVGFPPFGLILDVNGLLNGTPTAAGTREFEVCVKDLSGNQACGTTSLTVIEKTTVTISSATCEAVRFSWGGLMYIDVSASGSASGPVGTRLILPGLGIPSETPEEYSCGDWGDNGVRDTGEPPTTIWAVRGSAAVGQHVLVVYADGVSAEAVLDCPTQ